MLNRVRGKLLYILHNMRMREKMTLLFLLFGFLPMLLLSIIQLNAVIENLEEKTEQALSLSLHQAATRIETQMLTYNAVANNIVFDARIGPRLLSAYNTLGEAIYLYYDIWNLYTSVTRTYPSIVGVTVYTQNPRLITAMPYIMRVDDLHQLEAYDAMNEAVVTPYLSGARTVGKRQEYWYGESAEGTRVVGLSRAISGVSLRGESIGFVTLMIEEDAFLSLLDVDNPAVTVFLASSDQEILTSTQAAQSGSALTDLFDEQVLSRLDAEDAIHLNDAQDQRLMKRSLSGGLTLYATISMNEVRKPTRQIQALGIGVLCVTAFFAVLFVVFFVSRMTKRIRIMLNKMHALSMDLDSGEPIDGSDEIAELDQGFREMVVRLKDTTHDLYVVELEKKEAQLIALQSRINPHFLYNALSSIGWMIDTHQPDEVREAIDALARFYRSALSGGQDVITLREELRGLSAYLAIQSMRAGDRMKAHIDIDEILMDIRIPKMTLQPIVENSIEHGIDESHQHINILITSGVDERAALLVVQDDGAGISEEAMARINRGSVASASGGYGIQNVQMRLKLYFGEEYGLAIEARPEGGTRVTLRIPL